MKTMYNEIDPYPAQWLRNLAAAGQITPGYVDERSIVDLGEEDVAGLDRAHFFAGIGAWDYALRLAGLEDVPGIWTGSPPCQPFSDAGKRKGTDDERHLWPELRRLIEVGRPPIFVGEQVASKAGRAWLDAVRVEMEAMGYAFAAADLSAAGVGAPHIRQRLFFGAIDLRVADAGLPGLEGYAGDVRNRNQPRRVDESTPGSASEAVGVGVLEEVFPGGPSFRRVHDVGDRGPWGSDWLLCRDPNVPRWRPVEPGTLPLAHGATSDVGRLRAYGNAIVPQVAAEFVSAFLLAVLEGGGGTST